MKHIILCLCLLAWATAGEAAPNRNKRNGQAETGPCQYTFMQNVIRDAQDHRQVFTLIGQGMQMEDKTITCGGNLLQLAIRRGNPNIVNAIVAQDKERIKEEVSTSGFNITDAPETIPVVLFAAYYAPNEAVFKVFMDNGADITVSDSAGHNIFWYMNQNPVLRKTHLAETVAREFQKTLVRRSQKSPESETDIPLNQDTLSLPPDDIPPAM